MASLSRAVLATALAGTGLFAGHGAALAGEGHEHHNNSDEGGSQSGLVNVDDTQTTTPLQACNNNVPTNVGGVQVPVQDVAADIPLLSGDEEQGEDGVATGQDKACGQGADTTT